MFAHRLWNITTSSSLRSDSSSCLPFSVTSGCLRTSSQPMWEKKNPRLALWGSASVSEYLWWTRWSLAHSYMSFCYWRDRQRWRGLLEPLIVVSEIKAGGHVVCPVHRFQCALETAFCVVLLVVHFLIPLGFVYSKHVVDVVCLHVLNDKLSQPPYL